MVPKYKVDGFEGWIDKFPLNNSLEYFKRIGLVIVFELGVACHE